MAKFYGKVGYAVREKIRPGYYDNKIVEREYYGDYSRIFSKTENSGGVNDNVVIEQSIGIVADPYANEHFHQIIYVETEGVKWKVTKVDPQRPRIILTTGGVYNGEET